MPYLEIITSLGRFECINCGSHTYASRCGTCEGTALVPIAALSRDGFCGMPAKKQPKP